MKPYSQWLAEVDRFLGAAWGIDHEDCPLYHWHLMWRFGQPPGEAASKAFVQLVASLGREDKL